MKQKEHIGKVTSQKTVTIEESIIQQFVDALGIEDPLSTDPAAAKAANLSGLLLPHAAASNLGEYDSVISLLELKPKQVLHSKQRISVFRPICSGDTLNVTTVLGDLYEQQVSGNPMGFAIINVIGTTPKDAVAFESQRVVAVRGGFPRR
jgi:hypothetical protein